MTPEEQRAMATAEIRHRRADAELLNGCGALATDNERIHAAMVKLHTAAMEARRGGTTSTTPQAALAARLRWERAQADHMLAIVTAARVVLQEAVAHRMRDWPELPAGGDA